MRLTEDEAKKLVALRMAGLSHCQALQRLKRARKPYKATEAQLRHRALAAEALRLSQKYGVTLSEGWKMLHDPASHEGPNHGVDHFAKQKKDLTSKGDP